MDVTREGRARGDTRGGRPGPVPPTSPPWHRYADQSHLTRDFARFAGRTPTAYAALSTADETG